MVDTVTSQTLLDGPRNAVMKFTSASDGTGEAAVTKVDVSALAPHPSRGVCTEVRIDRIEANTQGMAVDILWDATADVLAWQIPQNTQDTKRWKEIGGLINNAGDGKTGDIKFTTRDHTAGDTYSVVLHMVKKYG